MNNQDNVKKKKMNKYGLVILPALKLDGKIVTKITWHKTTTQTDRIRKLPHRS